MGDQFLDLSEFDVAVLATIAYHQPVTRDGLKDIVGKEVRRNLIDPPPMKWSAVMFRKTEDQNGYETTQARGNCREAAAG